MRLTPLLPIVLALQGLENLGLHAQQPQNLNGNTDAANVQLPGSAGAEVMNGGGHGQPPLDLNSLGGVQQANAIGEPAAVPQTSEAAAANDEAPQTTLGPELLEMLEFMRRCIDDVLARLKAASQDAGGQGGGAPAPAAGGEAGAPSSGPAGATSPAASGPQAPSPAPSPAPSQQPAPIAAPANQGAIPPQSPPEPQAQGTPSTLPPQQAATAPPPADGAPPPSKASEPTAASSSSQGTQQYTLDGGGSYTHHLVNDTGKDMDVAYFKNNGPGMQPGFSGESLKVHLKAGEKADVSIPDDWQGRAQKYGGKMDDPATWAEFNNEPADASKGRNEAKTWFDVSKIPGGNANLTMTTGDGVTAGSDHQMLEAAKKDPRAANLLTKDAAGNDVFKPAQGFDGKTNKDVVDFFTQYEPEKAQAVTGNASGKFDSYILPNNDSATRVSQSKEMTLRFDDL